MKAPNAAERRALLEAGRAAIRAYAARVYGGDLPLLAFVADVHVEGSPRAEAMPRGLAARRLRQALPRDVLSDLEGLAAREPPPGHVLAIVPPFAAEHLSIAPSPLIAPRSRGRCGRASQQTVAVGERQ